uniref:Integrase catalytic domain-containing protein n=1 Tax=Nicotiana tabacum TaxID=4097 RepID=A0A1S3YG97_TOBAC|nr:PREDICTED: uncharacterized protein LOC107775941 [Nicotiana tabacum]
MAVHEMGDEYSLSIAPALCVEAGHYQKVGEHKVVDFLWENIICKFGIPKELAYDNGPQFIGEKVIKFLEDLKIKMITSSPYHSSANDQAESTNRVIVQNLRKGLEAAKGEWPEELSRSTMGVLNNGQIEHGRDFFISCVRSKSLDPD